MRRTVCLALCVCLLFLLLTCQDPTTASSDKEFLSFAFLTVDNPFLDEPVLAFIHPDDKTIYLTTSFPSPLNDFPLIARFTTAGVAVKWNTTPVISGATPLRYAPSAPGVILRYARS